MEFCVLSPFALKDLLRNPALERRLREKPAGLVRRRASSLNCYLPDGTATPHRRVTGAHLDPDSPEMHRAAMTLASSLLHAVYEDGVPARILISPARYSDKVLANYCQSLAKRALGSPGLDLVSPLLVPYLLGGMTYKGVEDLAHRAMEVMEFFPEPLGKPVMARALGTVGFGVGIPHIHSDDRVDATYVEPAKKRYNNLSHAQEYLLDLPAGNSYARLLLDKGAYDAALRPALTAMKLEVLEEVDRLLSPHGGEMTPFAASKRLLFTPTEQMFNRAVRRVFEKPWMDLDLIGDNDSRDHDGEVLIARLIIQRLSHKVLKSEKLSATTLVGMSLLTGVSVANWAKFAVLDLSRRGETFITEETVRQVIEIAGVSPYFTCAGELEDAAMMLRYQDLNKAKWARRLQSPNRQLWSTRGTFYQNGLTVEGNATYKHKPFSLLSD